MKIAVTGGSGELGRNLVPYLHAQGHQVVSIDRMMPAHPQWKRGLQYWVANTTNYGEVVGSLRGCEAVIHLAALRSPMNNPDFVVYNENTAGSYNVLSACGLLGIKRVCLASSVNAIGGEFSRSPRYDYFPLDEAHPTYAEDPYSLSKWVLEQQADSFARRYEEMSIASLRFHLLIESRELAVERTPYMGIAAIQHLWAYTIFAEACRACLLSVTADFKGAEVFYIVAPRTAVTMPTLDLLKEHYPNVELRAELKDDAGLYNCSRAEKILGWRHES